MSNTNGFVNLPTGIYLNVRKEPNLYSQVLASLAPKTKLTIIEQTGAWYQIEYNDEKVYVFAEAVTPSASVVQAGVNLNLNVPEDFEFKQAGEQPTFNWNALVTTSIIPIKDKNGAIKSKSFTSNGDHITIIKDNPQNGLTFIQYPDQGENLYMQGWIDSTYISDTYLDFRFDASWTNLIDNQKIYLFNDSISNVTLTKDTSYTLLYTVTNYNIEYSCILFKENDSFKTGFIPSTTGKLNFVVDNYPFNIANEESISSYLPTVPLNATLKKLIDLIDINGIRPNWNYQYNKKGKEILLPNGQPAILYPSLNAGTEISIIQAFNSATQNSILIEYFDSGSNTYLKGYLPTESLTDGSITINPSTLTWKTGLQSVDLVNLSDSKTIYTLPVSQKVQLLYCTKEFACILYNNNSSTGYIKLTNLSPETIQEYNLNIKLENLETRFNSFKNTETMINKQVNSNLASIDSTEKTLNTSINTLKEDILKNKNTMITTKSTLEKLKIDTGLIGGINLVEGSATNFGVKGLSSSAYGFGTGSVILGGGRTYTLTVCGSSTQESLDNNQHLAIEIYSPNWSTYGRLDFWELTPTIKQVTIKVPKTETYWINGYSMNYKPNSKDVVLYWYNVQEGGVGTAWVPSISDLKNQLLTKEKI